MEWKIPGSQSLTLVPREAFLTETGVTAWFSPGTRASTSMAAKIFGRGMVLWCRGFTPVGSSNGSVQMDLNHLSVAWLFFDDGRLLLSTFTPNNNGVLREATNGNLWVLDDVVGGSWSDITVDKVADGFHDPCGVVVVDGEIFVLHREGIDRLWDQDGDEHLSLEKSSAQPRVGDNYHHFSFGLVEHEDWIYGTLSTAIYFNNTIKADQVEGSWFP